MRKTIVTEEFDGAGVLKKRVVTTEDTTPEYPWQLQWPQTQPSWPYAPVITYTRGTATCEGHAVTRGFNY